MWGAQKFWGPKPGNQTGSRLVDDRRDMLLPLPAYLSAGGVTGPSGFAPGGIWSERVPMPQPLPAYPAGPSPMVPNDGDPGGKGNPKDNEKPKPTISGEEAPDEIVYKGYNGYHDSMEEAAGGEFARRDPDSSSGSGSSSNGSGSGRRSNPKYDQAGVKEALNLLKLRQKQALEAGEFGLARSLQDQIDEQERQIDVSGTPGDQASYWIEVGVAVATAFLPDPVGDFVLASLGSKAAAVASGLIKGGLRYTDDAAEQLPKISTHAIERFEEAVDDGLVSGDAETVIRGIFREGRKYKDYRHTRYTIEHGKGSNAKHIGYNHKERMITTFVPDRIAKNAWHNGRKRYEKTDIFDDIW